MPKITILGLGAAAVFSLAAAVTPALATYGHCTEEPDAADCRTYNMPGLPPARTGGTVQKPIVHAHNHHHLLPEKG